MISRFDQWGSFGPANTCGSLYKPPTESTISISFPPFSLALSFDSPEEEHRWIFHLTSICVPDRLPKHIALFSPSGRKQQPPWCCHNDREMNCECLDANMWVCRVITDANMSRHAERQREKQVFNFCPANIVMWRFITVGRKYPP